MSKPERSLQLWLPALARVEPAHPLREWLPRADRLPDGGVGYLGGLGDHFPGIDAGVPAAAITREFLACGRMGLNVDEAQALAEPLRPVFDEAGMQLELSTPDHWHLRLPADTSLPGFAAPEQALGEDLAQHLPQGAQGRRWRVLLNDVQVLLHQHPLNAARQARGESPVNSLWLWGGGCLPPPVTSELTGVVSDDLLLRALAARAGMAQQPRAAEAIAGGGAGWLIDLQDLPAQEIAARWWPALQPLLERQSVVLHFASGERWLHKPRHRWRLWRGAGR